MSNRGVIFGGAGTGKTTELLRLMGLVLDTEHVTSPMQIGFCSHTRAARAEAAERAGERYGVDPTVLQGEGWFRTIHAICHRMLRGVDLLTDDTASGRWVAEALDAPVYTDKGDAEGVGSRARTLTPVGHALHLWEIARAKLLPVRDVWEVAEAIDPTNTPWINDVEATIQRYEEAKSRDGKSDFTDLLLRVAGRRHAITSIEMVEEEGQAPYVPVWFFDEHQDTSALQNLVCQRLTRLAGWVYYVGDPFQAIYGFSGADPTVFRALAPESKTRTLSRSYRCPSEILNQGERILREASDYWDRCIEPREAGGEVETISVRGGWESSLEAEESSLILARTNYHVGILASMLDSADIPWGSTESSGNRSPSKAKAAAAIWELHQGGIIDGQQWAGCVRQIPSKFDGLPLLIHGTKKRFDAEREQSRHPIIPLSGLADVGATQLLIDAIRGGYVDDVLPECKRQVSQCRRYGAEVVRNPRVRLGTIHSAKGMEADNVYCLTSSTRRIKTSTEMSQAAADEECRVWYVAATRARNRLFWLNDYTEPLRRTIA